MLCYWILRRPDGTAIGLVRVLNDRVTLKPTVPVAGTFTLFSEGSAVPITPESETVLPGAVALLGTDGDRVTCFAAAENAASAAVYRKRLSRIYTIKTDPIADRVPAAPIAPNLSHAEEKPELNEESEDSLSHIRTISAKSVPDSVRDTQAFSALLNRAEAFFAAYEEDLSTPAVDNPVQKKDNYVEAHGIDLFAREYPGARWRYVDGTDVLPHYEGTWRQPNGPTLHILAVRGHAAPRPPRALFGFTRFLRDRDGTGYWLRLTPLP